ncbi:hypothetical protein F8B91_14775 [Aestuariivirga litoralis]|nr:hypothetical protein [Aestuariivirga litoralis]
MPILERDPWRLQYFEGVDCPEDVVVPTDDPDCWHLYPKHRWVYNKLYIAESQGVACGPHGVTPQRFPVFSKPIFNLKGMGVGSEAVCNAEQLASGYQPGHFWMELFRGDHVSTDCAVVRGEVKWLRHTSGVPGDGGTFKYWTVEATPRSALTAKITSWVKEHMAGYTGMMNFESIGGGLIEAHLRFADQWCDLYGAGWVEALVRLYARGEWEFKEQHRNAGYSIPLFAEHGEAFSHPAAEVQARIRAMPGIASLQITFHDASEGAYHAMPPGGFRLGVINAINLNAGLKARDVLARAFPGVEMLDASHRAEIPLEVA